MLQTTNVSYAYQGEAPMHFPDIDCGKGQHCLLLGQSGSGKTTFLHCLSGLRTPITGSIIVGDQDICRMKGGKLDHFRGKNIGMIFQEAHFIRSLNVVDNLKLVQKLGAGQIDEAKIEELLERLNLSHKKYSKTTALSVGEKQRIAIARALVNKPLVIFADEPTSALDDHHTEEVIQLLKKQADSEQALLFIVTHDQRLKNAFDYRIELT